MRVHPPRPVILTAISTFQRRAPTHFYQRPQTEKLATSVITRVYAEVGSALARRKPRLRACQSDVPRIENGSVAAGRCYQTQNANCVRIATASKLEPVFTELVPRRSDFDRLDLGSK